jgi:quercetin dioxygenase-like cupin family protein
MERRTARFSDLKFGDVACLDTLFPAHARKIAHVIGPGACEDPALNPAIPEAEDFHVVMIRAEQGKGASLHSHPTVEMFMPLSGEWTIYWGDEGEHRTRLGVHDVVSVPAGVMRGFISESEGEHLLLAINGEQSGPIAWPEKTVEDARRKGYTLNAEGFVVPVAKGSHSNS